MKPLSMLSAIFTVLLILSAPAPCLGLDVGRRHLRPIPPGAGSRWRIMPGNSTWCWPSILPSSRPSEPKSFLPSSGTWKNLRDWTPR